MKKWLLALIVVPLLVWGISLPDALWSQPQGFWVWRKESIFLFGVIAYVLMAWSVMLSVRWTWMEKMIGGLDRVYHLHKWSGIGAGIFLFLHWMAEIIPKSLVKAGVSFIPPRVKSGGPKPEGLLQTLTDFAKDIGEWVAYAALALIFIALIKAIPYHWFRKVHKAFPALFLLITFHSVMLMKDGMWVTLAGGMMIALMIVASIAALISLAQCIGRKRMVYGKVSHVERRANNMFEVQCVLEGAGMSRLPGQFSFARFDCTNEAHPFSMVSAPQDGKHATFMIKPLGDDTCRITETIKIGEHVRLEGPYGCFSFDEGKALVPAEQVWIGGGVGLTPFLCRLNDLVQKRRQGDEVKGPISFFYCAPRTQAAYADLAALCEEAGVSFYWIDMQADGPLTFDRVMAAMKNPKESSGWFCGPVGLGDMLESAWCSKGLVPHLFHREMFLFR